MEEHECIACFDSRSELIQLARNIHQRIDHHLPVAPAATSIDAMPQTELAERRQRRVGVIKHLHKHLGDLLGVAPVPRPARLQDGGWCGFCFMSSREDVVLERGFPVSGFISPDLRFPQRSSASIGACRRSVPGRVESS